MIPYHWDVVKLKYLLKDIRTGSTPSSNKQEYFEGTIKWYTPGDFLGTKMLESSSRTLNDLAIYDGEAKLFPGESVLLVGIGATLGKVGMLKEEASFNQQITGLLVNEALLNPNFLYYWLRINKKTILEIANYTTLPIINNEFINNFDTIAPPICEQNIITKYLDSKTTQINYLIAVKERLIELLKEKRQAVITETVTKGLDSNVKMKDSGIEWIGEIPEHWETTKIKYTTYVKGRIGWQGLRSDEFIDVGPHLVTGTDFQEGNVNWSTCYRISEERYEEAPEIQLKNEDLLITKDGTIGKTAIVKNKPQKAILNSGVFVTRPYKEEYLTEYLYWVLNSSIFIDYIDIMSSGTTVRHLYQETFKNFIYPLPNLPEQKRISELISNQTSHLNDVINQTKIQISKLKEYRESLIYEAVTGKIDVRDYAPDKQEVY